MKRNLSLRPRSEIPAAKALGQHFLADERMIDHMVRAIFPRQGEAIFEIGAGLGALTLPVLERCGAMMAVDFDERVIARLRAKALSVGKLDLLYGDFLELRLADLAKPQPADKWRVIGNLPYNLSSPILIHCLEQRDAIQDMHFMLQKEVVDRICAEPDSKDFGRLSLLIQRFCEPEYLFDIPPEAFDPPPKVDSAVVRLTVLPQSRWDIDDESAFDFITRTAFTQRRKMLRKSLGAWFSEREFEDLGINPTARPENLGGEMFAVLANALAKRGR
ncbi:MAG: 16S rRNA (adenine(1518)-N(6)/adenine(1519)-N(6))-dimethyltransferase RsmA [Cardiobacteriaceae bacterium]|nr:16S rRNA (adenine(1518)-N(6)/adenine(1519)-N(6))-dimethyltransferase RsmA [Cardiobacteriaceae bacterium]